MALNDLLAGWRFKLDNPTILGWSVVGVYIVAALCCVLRALRGPDSESHQLWWLFAALLLFLGVNKQLNLQTMLIVMGRNLARIQGWSSHARAIQRVCGVAFAMAGIGVMVGIVSAQRQFFKRNRCALAGVVILFCFVALRAATINHVEEFFHVTTAPESWTWILEITGSALIAIEAISGLCHTTNVKIT